MLSNSSRALNFLFLEIKIANPNRPGDGKHVNFLKLLARDKVKQTS